MKKVEVICYNFKSKISEEEIPDSLWFAIKQRKNDYRAGLVSKELFRYEMSACMNNKIGKH